jgi:hypothetical protein
MKLSADNKVWINLNIGYGNNTNKEVGTAKILGLQMD